LDHIEEHHKPSPTSNNKGEFYCSLCNVRVKSKQQHYCSKLHRWNIENNSVDPQYYADDYITHYEKYLVDVIENDEDHPFWKTAKEQLSKDDYKKIKEYINGRGKNITSYSRHLRLRRLGRTSKGNKTNSKKTSRRKSYSRI
jgi:hypothetical protein